MLNVDAVVGGSLWVSRDSLHVTVNLQGTSEGSEVWEEVYVWRVQELPTLVEEIAGGITDQLEGVPGDGTDSPVVSQPDLNWEAWELYVRGVEAVNSGDQTGLEDAIGHFAAAIQVDPAFAPAFAGMADALLHLTSDSVGQTIAVASVALALALDPTSEEAHTIQGRLWNEPGSWAEAEQEFRSAIRYNSSYAPAHMWLGNNLLVRGRSAEGLDEFQEASRLDPGSASIAVGLSQALSATGDPWGAIDEARRATRINPTYPYGHSALAVALAAVGQFDEALVEASLAVDPLDPAPNAEATLAAVHARAGTFGEARMILERLRSLPGRESLLPSALVFANLAELDSAFVLLNRVPSWNPPSRDWLRNSPIWSPVREDPRWRQLLGRQGMG
ncbi:tetratricopeptide repeat protein [Gemmatimonadota bacterium]